MISSIRTLFLVLNVINLIVSTAASDIDIESLNHEKPVDMVIVIARHGWRTAGETRYPNDPFKDREKELWPEGLLELTNRGKMDEYKLGIWLSQRYETVLRDGYSSQSVYAVSTNADRSVMSAMCLMSGLFPPRAHQIWNPDLLWQPIPVHSHDNTATNLLNAYTKVNCPKYWEEFEKMKQSPEYVALFDKFRPLREYIFNSTTKDLADFKDIEYFYDYVDSLALKNETLPDWAEKIYPEPWRSAALYYFVIPTSTEPLKRFFMGPLLKEITEQLASRRSGLNNRTFYLLSGHDDNVSNLLNLLGTFNWIIPPFSSAVLLELRKSASDDYFVTIFYKNSTGEPFIMKAMDCELVCPLDSFISMLTPYIPQDWDSECTGWTPHTSSAGLHKGDGFALLLIMVSLMITQMILIFFK